MKIADNEDVRLLMDKIKDAMMWYQGGGCCEEKTMGRIAKENINAIDGGLSSGRIWRCF